MSNYIKTIYNEKDRPITSYPDQLTKYLFDKFNMCSGMKFIEIGCGRGDFLKGFQKLGLDVCGFDISEEAVEFNQGIEIKIGSAENLLPYEDNTFDIIYSKSLIEHLNNPDKYIKEAYRILKPGGILLTLVPDWEANYRTYFDDYTHRTPFTVVSLKDIYKMFNLKNVEVVRFRQLPIVWKYPVLNYFCVLISKFLPTRINITCKISKFLFWSKEIMLIGYGAKETEFKIKEKK